MIRGHDIVCIASADFDAPAWLNVQHLMSRLAQGGNRVLYVESLGLRAPSPFHSTDVRKIGRRLRRLIAGLRRPSPNLSVIAPHALPGQHNAFIQGINRRLLRTQIRSAMHRLKMREPLLWIFLPTGQPLVHQLSESRVIYHCVDDYLANPGVPVEALKTLEDRLVAQADAVIVTAPRLMDKFEGRARRLAWIPSGVDMDAYQASDLQAEPPDLKRVPRPRIGFVGNLADYKVDFSLLNTVIKSRPQWSFVVIGALGAGDPFMRAPSFLKHSNVHWLGEKPHPQIPAYLLRWDAGLIPYRRSRATDAVFPIKLFEYLAAGLPVVATPLPSLERYREFCELASDAASFVSALDRAVENPGRGSRERKALARQNSWEARLEDVSNFLNPFLSPSAASAPHV